MGPAGNPVLKEGVTISYALQSNLIGRPAGQLVTLARAMLGVNTTPSTASMAAHADSVIATNSWGIFWDGAVIQDHS